MIKHRLEFQGKLENLKKIQELLTNICPLTKKEEKLCFCNLYKLGNGYTMFPNIKMEEIKNLEGSYGLNNKSYIYLFETDEIDVYQIARFLSIYLYNKDIKVEVVYHYLNTINNSGGKTRMFKVTTLADRYY